ncbi:pseudouridine synthase [Ochromonadaceae sp. CCMP2298]|nr:pseudouridine synthase [Ochromonadaceae sp. CCMP2298]KAJ1426892.1 pseudouridine synthase [Ochromonadaceae sp. CCMP2298]
MDGPHWKAAEQSVIEKLPEHRDPSDEPGGVTQRMWAFLRIALASCAMLAVAELCPRLGRCITTISQSSAHQISARCFYRATNTALAAAGKESLRLERIISNRGASGRKEATELIRQGRVSVQGQVVRSGARKYSVDIAIEVDGKALDSVPLLALYNKPVGVHSTMGDPRGRPNLEDLVGEYAFLKSMHPVGRLDADTSGLLLFSSSGQLTQLLLHPSSAVDRVYEAIVAGDLSDPLPLRQKLALGVKTTDGTFPGNLKEAFPLPQPTQQSLAQTDVCQANQFAILRSEGGSPSEEEEGEEEEGEGEGEERDQRGGRPVAEGLSCARLSVTEGKYRMVRRMLHNAGHSVLHLHRLQYGGVVLQSSLAEGQLRPCSEEERVWAEKLLLTAQPPQTKKKAVKK